MTARRPLADCPEQLQPEARRRIRIWTSEHYPTLLRQLPRLWAQHRDHSLARGILRHSWEHSFRSWIAKAHEFAMRDAVQVDRPRPRPASEPEPLGRVIEMFQREPRR